MGEEVRPLDGVLVLDLTRMLPGAVLARILLDLGARLVKIEEPGRGDPMRHAPPLVDGIGVGFSVFFRGAESVTLDLRDREGLSALCRLARDADVLVESFRPGTLASWGASPERLHRENPRLTLCSLSGFAPGSAAATTVGHDLNFVGKSGVLSRLPALGVPRMQVADVATGILASSAILAALLERTRTGRGRVITQPVAAGPLPLVLWPWADAAAGGVGVVDTVLAGLCPAYRLYACADDTHLAVGCLEPKFWASFCQAVGLPDLAPAGLDAGAAGQDAAARMAERLATQPAQTWAQEVAGLDLPVTAVNDIDAAREDAAFEESGLLERTPMPDGSILRVPGPALPALGRTPTRPAPRLGEHNERVFAGPVDKRGQSDPG